MEENKEQKVLSGQASAEQIAMWKKLHRDVIAIKTDNVIAYFRKADRTILSMVSSLDGDPIRQAESILSNCFIGGDRAILENDADFLAAVSEVAPLIEFGKASVEKL